MVKSARPSILIICLQIVGWCLTAFIISNPRLNIWIAGILAVVIPITISLVLIINEKTSNSGSYQKLRWYGITLAAIFIVLNQSSLITIRYYRMLPIMSDAMGRIDSAATRIDAASVDAAILRDRQLPDSLFELVERYHMPTDLLWPINENEVFVKPGSINTFAKYDGSQEFISRHAQFDYYGKGMYLRPQSSVGLVVLVSKDIFADGRRLLFISESSFWLSRSAYHAIESQVESCQPVSIDYLKDHEDARTLPY